MATLTTAELVLLRRKAAEKARELDIPIRWVKGAINAAAQAVEDAMDAASFKSQVSSDMDTATSPFGVTFTNAEKKWIGAHVKEIVGLRDKQ